MSVETPLSGESYEPGQRATAPWAQLSRGSEERGLGLLTANTQTIGVLDTSIASENLGDFIIMDAAQRQIDECLPRARQVHLPTHEKLSAVGRRIQRQLDFNLACGTNLLHAHMELVKQWNLGLLSALSLRPVVLLGVGWRSQAKRRTSPLTRWLLRKILSRTHLHSVRDSYTQRRLQEIGISNVINTGCPTMWGLTEHHCAQIPTAQGEDVVLTLTDYSQSPEHDRQLIMVLARSYRQVFLWCQGTGDLRYFRSLEPPASVQVFPPTLLAYDQLLGESGRSLDYVGTRLHGGIRALQHKRRSLIIGVDHRALEKGRDFQLPVIDRYLSADALTVAVRGAVHCQLSLPLPAIRQWQHQFEESAAGSIATASRP